MNKTDKNSKNIRYNLKKMLEEINDDERQELEGKKELNQDDIKKILLQKKQSPK